MKTEGNRINRKSQKNITTALKFSGEKDSHQKMLWEKRKKKYENVARIGFGKKRLECPDKRRQRGIMDLETNRGQTDRQSFEIKINCCISSVLKEFVSS